MIIVYNHSYFYHHKKIISKIDDTVFFQTKKNQYMQNTQSKIINKVKIKSLNTTTIKSTKREQFITWFMDIVPCGFSDILD